MPVTAKINVYQEPFDLITVFVPTGGTLFDVKKWKIMLEIRGTPELHPEQRFWMLARSYCTQWCHTVSSGCVCLVEAVAESANSN